MKQYILVNLLPYREIERREQKKQLAIYGAFAVLAGIFIISVIAGVYSAQIENQEDRNRYLVEENKKLEDQIVKIKELKDKLKVVLARKNVVEELQITRVDAVNLLNTVVQKLPDAMYLKSMKQNGNKITLVGITQSSAKVAAFMNALEDSTFSTNPQLVEIKAVPVAAPVARTGLSASAARAQAAAATAASDSTVSEFTLTFDILRKKAEDPKTVKAKRAKSAKPVVNKTQAIGADGVPVPTPAPTTP